MVHSWRRVLVVRKSDLDFHAGDIALSGPALANILGVTEQRVRQLAQADMPKISRGKYPLKASVQWYVRYWKARTPARRLDQLKRKKTLLQIHLLQVRVQEATGRLIHRIFVQARQDDIHQLDRMLNNLPWAMGRKFSWSRETILDVRDFIDAERNNFVHEFTERLHGCDESQKGQCKFREQANASFR